MPHVRAISLPQTPHRKRVCREKVRHAAERQPKPKNWSFKQAAQIQVSDHCLQMSSNTLICWWKPALLGFAKLIMSQPSANETTRNLEPESVLKPLMPSTPVKEHVDDSTFQGASLDIKTPKPTCSQHNFTDLSTSLPQHPCHSESTLQEPPKKKLRSLPPDAPRTIVKQGKFTFIKNVRIREYRLPQPKAMPSPPRSLQFQCRDGFDQNEIYLGYPQPMTKSSPVDQRHAPGTVEESINRLPLTPTRTTLFVSTRGRSN
ncbi:hypothetical protein PT974_12055 [Cladobotryum mycophilum]|uniref:Uncharacterized protein n=1 Tax=Cladobotryum mycophilum TaxID=491253 RepID=A0ABR0S7H8_9HYPO